LLFFERMLIQHCGCFRCISYNVIWVMSPKRRGEHVNRFRYVCNT